MDFVSLSKSRHFLDAKPVRVPVFDRPRLAAELVCLVPEQKETRRMQDICDELFVVIEGTGTLRSGANVQELEASDAVVVPPGVERTLTNTGATPLSVLVALSPKPSFANQSSPRRNMPRRDAEVEGEAAEPEGVTEQAGFDESRSGPSIGRPKRAVAPHASEDRPRGAPRGGSGPMRNDTFNNFPSRREDDRPAYNSPRPEGEAAGAAPRRPYNRDGAGGAPRRPFNRNDRPARPPFNREGGDQPARPAYGAGPRREGPRPPFRPRPDGAPAGDGPRPPFNRDSRPARPAYGGSRNGRPAGGRPYRDTSADARPRRMPGSVAGSTTPEQRLRDAGPEAESRFRRPAPARGAARPAGNRSGPARPRRAPFNSKEGTTPVGQRGRGPAQGSSGTYSPHGAAGRMAAPRKAGPGGATKRPTGRPAPARSAPRTSKPRSPRA
jgi:quercetin dioxygenase-like cupin family protein